MKKKLWTHFMLMLMVLGSFFFAFKPAAAQTGTTVYFLPDPANVYINETNSQVVDLMIAGAVDLISYDIKVTYDSNITTIQSVAFGGFFDSGGCVRTTNTPGFLWYSCFQYGSSSPKSGSGSVLRLTFTGQSAGTTPLTFTKAEMSDVNKILIIATPIDGKVNVIDSSAIIFTTLSGSFDLQGRVDRGGIPVTLSEAQFVGQGPYTVPTTNVPGDNLAFTNVAMDVYTVSTGQAGYLNISPEMGRQIALLASGNVLPPLRLIGGNAVWTGHATSNDQIDIFDVALVSGEIGKITFNPDADINGNGKVDIFDLAMVAGNYGMNSVDAYAGWMQ